MKTEDGKFEMYYVNMETIYNDGYELSLKDIVYSFLDSEEPEYIFLGFRFVFA